MSLQQMGLFYSIKFVILKLQLKTFFDSATYIKRKKHINALTSMKSKKNEKPQQLLSDVLRNNNYSLNKEL